MSDNSRVIGDEELVLHEKGKDILKTEKYVKQLLNIIKNLSDQELKHGFNIGLYGGWGSGKTSIVKTLECEIESYNKECEEKGNKKIEVIDFDCWKYANDDLRRSILLEIAKKYNSEVQGEVKHIVYHDRQEINKKTGPDFDLIKDFFKWLRNNWSRKRFIIIFILIGILSIGLILLSENYHTLFNVIISGGIITSLSAIVQLIGKISDYIKEFIPRMEITHNIVKGKAFSGEQFEEIFKILIQKNEGDDSTKKLVELIKENEKTFDLKNKKILFVFDNIDRCESATVKEILMTIKTFLNQDDCIFLLPIDYENICKSYKEYDQGNEYLRKIFNLGILLEKPKYDNLWNLVEQTILQNERREQFGISENEISEIAYILSLVFSDNPRKIKQFLNNLGAEYLLYKKEIDISLLTKKLIIQQEIPGLYNILLKNKWNHEEIMKILESYAGKYEKYYQDYNKYKKEENWDNYMSFLVFNQLKRLTERELQIINHLSEIHGDFLNIGDYKNALKDLIDNQQYEDFKNNIKKDDKLEHQARLLFEEYSKQIGKSNINDKKYIIGFIYFYVFFSQDDKLLRKIFIKTQKKYFEKVLLDLNIRDNIFFDFIEIVKVEDIKIMGKEWISSLYTNKLLGNEKNINDFRKYEDDLKKKELLIDINVISQNIENNLQDEAMEETLIYKFLQNNKNYIPKKLIQNFNMPNRIDACSIEIINRIKLLSLLDDSEECNKKIGIILINSAGLAQGNTKYMDNYLLLSSILAKQSIMAVSVKDVLVNVYRTFSDKKWQVEDIFYDYVKSNKTFERTSYSDVIIDLGMKKVIEEMIRNTNIENGLSDVQINKIYRNYGWNVEENKGIVLALWNNKSLKNQITNYIKNESFSSIKGKIKNIEQYKKITDKDRSIFGEIIYKKIIEGLGSKNKGIIDELYNFFEENGNFTDYISKKEKEEIIKILKNYSFPTDDKEGPYYENRIKEIVSILEKNKK